METGTFTGTSTQWAANEFDWVVSIDKMDTHYRTAHARCSKPGLRCFPQLLRGDSRIVLVPVIQALETLDRRAIFYLDAHDINNMYGGGSDCPVLLELHFIMMSPLRHAVLIDDAHDFQAPPIPEYPDVDHIMRLVVGDYHTSIAHDLIVIVPAEAQDELEAFVAG